MKRIKPIEIAPYFIQKGVSPLKLQKLLYYAQVWFFVRTGNKLFEDKIQAWIYGPVVYEIWDRFRFMRRSRIIPKNRLQPIDLGVIETHLDDVWKAYGHLKGADLVDLTHEELPWKNSRKGLLNDEPSGKEVLVNEDTTSDFILNEDHSIPKAQVGKTFGHYSNY